MVDSGVDLIGDLDTARITRTSLDGGDPGDVDPRRHGTRMAMAAAAAVNGVGMIGAWPGVRILSVRAAAPPPVGERAGFEFVNYTRAVQRCLSDPTVVVVNLALGGEAPTSESETAAFVDKVVKAHAVGVSVTAAAGNEGGPVQTPARLPGVVAVGAGDGRGSLCELSSRGPELDLIAPGCGLDVADPFTLQPLVDAAGTSQASTIAAVAGLAALRSYRPDLTRLEAESLVMRGASRTPALDVAASFEAAGLASVVREGRARIPATDEPPRTSPAPHPQASAPVTAIPPAQQSAPQPAARPVALTSPTISAARCRRGVVAVTVVLRLGGTQLHVEVRERRPRRASRWRRIGAERRAARRVTVRVGSCRRAMQARVRFERYGERSDTEVVRVL